MTRAEENIEAFENIVLDIRNKVELDTESVSMQKISILQSEEDLRSYIPLGLNDEYHQGMRFSKQDLILLGGRRGAGKSFTCTNIAVNQYLQDQGSIYFTIEMSKEQILIILLL